MRILLTRELGRNDALAARLRDIRHEPVECPLIATEPTGDGPVDVDGYDWVVVTSTVGARELRKRMRGRPSRVAAVGRATAEAFGGAVDLVPDVATQEGLLAELPRPAGRVLVAAAAAARRVLADELGADFVPLYRTHQLRPELPPHDLAVLASGSAARAYAAAGAPASAVSIGPVTSGAARAAGVTIRAEATTPDVEGLVRAVEDACSSRS